LGDPDTDGGVGGNGGIGEDVGVPVASEEAACSMAVVIGVDLFGCVVNGTGGGGPAWESGGMGDITGVGAELAGEPEGRDGHSGSTMGERRADGSVISKKGDGVLSRDLLQICWGVCSSTGDLKWTDRDERESVRSANEKGDCNELPDNMGPSVGSLLGPAIGDGRQGHLGRGTGTC